MRILPFLLAIALPITTSAQYQEVRERKAGENRPLAEFVTQKEMLSTSIGSVNW